MSNSQFSLDYYYNLIISDTKRHEKLHGIEYMEKHRKRFEETVGFLSDCWGTKALEIGATDFFQVYLNEQGYEELWGTIFSTDIEEKFYTRRFDIGDFGVDARILSLDIESELFPFHEPYFDLIIMCEVIEHFDIDPMFALVELNRILKMGGKLLITTPNSCSARNAYKACLGYRPHFFMQYSTDRSPHRHNFEHDIHSLLTLIHAAGFEVVRLETHDVFDEPDSQAIKFLQKNSMPLEFRGDDIFLLVQKVSTPKERWPQSIYYRAGD
jgi:SAM-dependent methyltransferase